jgi:hypothetical protein
MEFTSYCCSRAADILFWSRHSRAGVIRTRLADSTGTAHAILLYDDPLSVRTRKADGDQRRLKGVSKERKLVMN